VTPFRGDLLLRSTFAAPLAQNIGHLAISAAGVADVALAEGKADASRLMGDPGRLWSPISRLSQRKSQRGRCPGTETGRIREEARVIGDGPVRLAGPLTSSCSLWPPGRHKEQLEGRGDGGAGRRRTKASRLSPSVILHPRSCAFRVARSRAAAFVVAMATVKAAARSGPVEEVCPLVLPPVPGRRGFRVDHSLPKGRSGILGSRRGPASAGTCRTKPRGLLSKDPQRSVKLRSVIGGCRPSR
jgi:hypothetical protein